MKRIRTSFCLVLLSVVIFLATSFITSSSEAQNAWTTLLQDDFEDGIADGWHFSDSEGQPLTSSWPVEEDGSSLVLSGSDHTWANIDVGHEWSDYSIEVRIKLISGGVHLNFRLGDIGRYFLNFNENGLSLGKQIWPNTFYDLGSDDTLFDSNTWYNVKIVCDQDNFKVYIDGQLKLEYNDPYFLSKGAIAFETLDDSHIHFDDLLVVGELTPMPPAPPPLPSSWTPLFEDDFEDGFSEGWDLGAGWGVEKEPSNNYVLNGSGHNWANPYVEGWKDCAIQTKIKLISGGFHFNFRISEQMVSDSDRIFARYFLGIQEDGLFLRKQIGQEFLELNQCPIFLSREDWHQLRIDLEGTSIKIYMDDALRIDFVDNDEPLLFGKFAFETLNDSHIQFDDVVVFGEPPPSSPPGYTWSKTGGPSGGLGYDVRIHPLDKNIMFVTDNPSGVNKSYDAGITWTQRNQGITSKTGASGDGIPIFSLTIDPSNPDIVWAGTQNAKGIYKSIDGGESWIKKDNGVIQGDEISFRNFGVHPNNSNIVFAGAEISTGILGREFDKTRGMIYRTVDGGENWMPVWEGDNLVRFVLFDPTNPEIMYASTGIFDREAYNDVGVGILKSTDGGDKWFQINNGIPNSEGNRFVGFLERHPINPQILFAASGNNANGPGGIFRTKNGGASWEKLLSDDNFTVVTISPSNPSMVYAGSGSSFYRSNDSGDTWQRFWKETEGCWGPPGIRAGFPISAVVDPDDPYTLFANNYGGGNFKSTDGAQSWVDASKGYTGAHLHDIAIDADNPAIVYTLGRSGPFRSYNGGDDWSGLAYGPGGLPEWNAIAINPDNPQEVLISDEFEGIILKSTNWGNDWSVVFHHPDAGQGDTIESRHGFKAIACAPSNPNTIYAGMRKGRRSIDGDFPARPSFGMYKSTDSAETWVKINSGLSTSLININCIAVDPTDPNIVYVGTWKDGVFKTTNGGQGWVLKNNGLVSADVRSLAIDPQNPQVAYAGLGEGAGIFKTTNGGELWGEINNGIALECPSDLLPIGKAPIGFSLKQPQRRSVASGYYSVPWTSIWSIAIDPTNSQTIFAADHQSGVYLSTDGGANWFPINEGLSNKAVNAIAVSSDGKVFYAATEGEGLFRIGSVTAFALPDNKNSSSPSGGGGSSCFIGALRY